MDFHSAASWLRLFRKLLADKRGGVLDENAILWGIGGVLLMPVLVGMPAKMAKKYDDASGIYVVTEASQWDWQNQNNPPPAPLHLTGTNAMDTLEGGDGNDWLEGLNGQDTLIGGKGGDILDGGAGDRRIDYASYETYVSTDGVTGLTVNLMDTSMNTGDARNDTYISIEGIIGSNYNDILYGLDGADHDIGRRIYGRGGDDIIHAGQAAGTCPWSGSCYLAGAELYGEEGNDTLYGSEGTDYLDGGDGDDTIYSGAGGDEYGNRDQIFGGAGNDKLYGGDGPDEITGGAGADLMEGGTGINTLYYLSSSEGVNVNLGTNTVSGGDAEGDIISNFQNLYGSEFNDNLVGSNDANSIAGAGGNDTIDGGNGDDQLSGGTGDDTITGGEGADFIDGGDGSDHILATTGEDRIYGGAGVDTADYSSASAGVALTIEPQACGHDSDTNNCVGTIKAVENVIGSGFDDTFNLGSIYPPAGPWETASKPETTVTINGGLGNDTYNVGAFGDGEGMDYTFAFNTGDGQDRIVPHNFDSVTSGKIKFGPGISSSSVSFSWNLHDLIIDYGGGNTVTIEHADGLAGHYVSTIEFNDGSTMAISYAGCPLC